MKPRRLQSATKRSMTGLSCRDGVTETAAASDMVRPWFLCGLTVLAVKIGFFQLLTRPVALVQMRDQGVGAKGLARDPLDQPVDRLGATCAVDMVMQPAVKIGKIAFRHLVVKLRQGGLDGREQLRRGHM